MPKDDRERENPQAEAKRRGDLEGRAKDGAAHESSDREVESVRIGAELSQKTTEAAVATTALMADAGGAAFEAEALEPVEAANLSEQAIPSKGYGDFVREVGLAVAAAQDALDENSVEAAVRLAKTEIPALVALNQVVNEDGEVESVSPLIQENARLIQYIQPTFYQWARVFLRARFDIKSFASNARTEIQSSLSVNQRGFSIGGGASFGRGRLSGGYSSNQTDIDSSSEVQSEYSNAFSSGSSLMEAELRPRTDARFPPPIVAIQGPRLVASTTATSLAAPDPAADPPKPATVEITFGLFKKDGFKEPSGKTVTVTLEGPGQLGSSSVALTDGGDGKNLTGKVTLTRRASDSAGTAVVTGTIGTLKATVAIRFTPEPEPETP